MVLCGIYKIHNKNNNKSYIGKSTNILSRWSQHIDAARLGKEDYEFYKDLKELSNFTFEILILCKEEELQKYEQEFIDKFNSYENGYNQVQAIDKRKEEIKNLSLNILKAIDLLEHSKMFFQEIADETGLSVNTIYNINNCKSYKNYHNYKKNIREESNNTCRRDKGELNPMSKLTEEQVLEIIQLLKEGELTNKQIAQKFNVSSGCINNINTRHRWKHLSTEFVKNIRNESKGEFMSNEVSIS